MHSKFFEVGDTRKTVEGDEGLGTRVRKVQVVVETDNQRRSVRGAQSIRMNRHDIKMVAIDNLDEQHRLTKRISVKGAV